MPTAYPFTKTIIEHMKSISFPNCVLEKNFSLVLLSICDVGDVLLKTDRGSRFLRSKEKEAFYTRMFNHDAVCIPLAALDSELEKGNMPDLH